VVDKLILPSRTKLIVQLPDRAGSRIGEGLVEREEIASGVYLVDSLVKIKNDRITTSILDTREQEVGVPNTLVEVVDLKDRDVRESAVTDVAEQEKSRDDPGQSGGERVIDKLRTYHLNSEEKKSHHELCFDCQDVFFLPGGQIKKYIIETILYGWCSG
jgi:hypothetical protein